MMSGKKVSSPNNIWEKEGFLMCGLGEKSKIIAKVKYVRKIADRSRAGEKS